MSTQTKTARDWLDANPKATAININAYVSMVEHAESTRAETAHEIVAWLRTFACSLKVAVVIELLAEWVEQNYATSTARPSCSGPIVRESASRR